MLGKAWSESEETEVKKNKEWAFIELGKLFPSHAEMYDYPDNITVMKCELLNKVYDILSQLDEPEVLSQEWIGEHTWHNHYVRRPFVYVKDLQNLLVPKQEVTEEQAWNKIAEYYPENIIRLKNGFEHWYYNQAEKPTQDDVDQAYKNGFKEGKRQTAEYFENITEEPSYEQVQKYLSEHGVVVVEKPVIPQFVAEYLDFAKSDTTLMRVLELANTRNEWERWEKEYDWIEENHELFARAWLGGFTVEKEQKYYVEIINNLYLKQSSNGDFGVGSIPSDIKYQFTEQEIRDYDPRYMAFAVKVEELEE